MNALVAYDISHDGLRRAVYNFLNHKFRDNPWRTLQLFRYNPRELTATLEAGNFLNQKSVIVYLEEDCLDSVDFKHLVNQVERIMEHKKFTSRDKILCCKISKIISYPYDPSLDWG